MLEAWTKVDPPTYMVVTPLGRPLKEGPGKIVVYTDGSGGLNTKDPRLRRCGWAWIIVGDNGQPRSGSCGNFLGPQIVPRAELTAFIELLRSLEEAEHITEVEIWSDCEMVVDRFNGGKERCMKSKLWELWRDFWKLYAQIKSRMTFFMVQKVRAHYDDTNIVPEEHRAGNNMADHYAGGAVVEVTSGD